VNHAYLLSGYMYCSNFYGELREIEQCDLCQSEVKNIVASNNSKKPVVPVMINCSSSGCFGGSEKRKSSLLPSPRRKYKVCLFSCFVIWEIGL